MQNSDPPMETMKASDVRQEWSQILEQVFSGEKRVIVENGGVPVAALISAEDFARLTQLEREQQFRVLERIGAAFQDVPDEELEQELTRALAEARTKLRDNRIVRDENT